jgi:Uncharacterized conserved protein
LTIVISEETGEVSITKNNELLRGLTQEDYLKFLKHELVNEEAATNHNILETALDWIDQRLHRGRR